MRLKLYMRSSDCTDLINNTLEKLWIKPQLFCVSDGLKLRKNKYRQNIPMLFIHRMWITSPFLWITIVHGKLIHRFRKEVQEIEHASGKEVLLPQSELFT